MSFSMNNSNHEDNILPDHDKEPALIDDIDNNGYLVHDEEMEPINGFEGSYRYPIIGKFFTSSDEAFNFYNQYGLSKGFGIRMHQHSRYKATNEIYRRIFVCNKQGFKNMNDKRQLRDDVKRRSIKRTGCKAMIRVSLSKHGGWVVDKFTDEHNHPLDPPSMVFKQRSHSIFHRSNECKDAVTLLSKAGLTPSQITKVVNAFRGDTDDRLTRVQCSAIVSDQRKSNIGKECHGVITHFQAKSELEKDFYFALELNTDGTLRNVFWADGTSRSSYCQFGDVVVFDSTYKTNRFGLPFAPFVGVNHHGQSILFGGALLEDETETTFTWLFKQFLKCMNECPPVSIITDQDLAMGKAISKVFPNTRHRYCIWHIQRHILEHLQPLRTRYNDFQDTFDQWVKSQSIEDFESRWEGLKEKYNISDDSWLGNMFKLRHKWIKAYLKDTFWAAMTTSQRSESINSFFDGFVNSKTMLNEFVVQYDKAVSSRRSAEKDEDFRTLNTKPTLHSDHPIESMAAACYTRNIYDMFKEEWKNSFNCGHETRHKDSNHARYRVGYLKGNKENWKNVEYKTTSDFETFATCSCAKFETCGILCKHILYIMRRKSLMFIPNHYILPRWTMKAANKVEVGETKSKDSTDHGIEEVSLLSLWSVRTKFNKLLEEGRDSLTEIQKVDDVVTGLLEEQIRRKKSTIEAETDTILSSPMQLATCGNTSQQFPVLDPLVPAKTKGRPKKSTRIKSSIEVAMDPKKKRKCGYCQGTGHNITGCQRKKMDDASTNIEANGI